MNRLLFGITLVAASLNAQAIVVVRPPIIVRPPVIVRAPAPVVKAPVVKPLTQPTTKPKTTTDVVSSTPAVHTNPVVIPIVTQNHHKRCSDDDQQKGKCKK